MSREELYGRASLEILHLNMSQTPIMCVSRILYLWIQILGCSSCSLQVTLLDRMLWFTLFLLSIAECDIKTCIINKTACDLGFQPVVAISEDGCCPVFSCSKYHISLRCFIYSLNSFIYSKWVKIISSSFSPSLSAFTIGAFSFFWRWGNWCRFSVVNIQWVNLLIRYWMLVTLKPSRSSAVKLYFQIHIPDLAWHWLNYQQGG